MRCAVWARVFKGARDMKGYVTVALSIKVPVDGEYSYTEHAEDIIASTRRFFTMAEVEVLEVKTSLPNGTELKGTNSK
jgi:hypothetical protein